MGRRPQIVPARLQNAYPARFRAVVALLVNKVSGPSPEVDEERILRKYLRSGDSVVEVGALMGGSSCVISSVIGEHGSLISFEANPHAFRHLQMNTRRRRNVRVSNVAVSDKDGLAYLSYFAPNKTLLDPGASIVVAWGSQIPVKAITLDNAMQTYQIRKVDALIIDAEGAELSILVGGSRMIQSLDLRVVSVEMHHYALPNLEEKVNALLASYKFRLAKTIILPSSFRVTINVYLRD